MMFDESKLKKTFINSLGLEESEFSRNLKMGESTRWDSVGHLSLIFSIESDFDIKFDIEMIPELISVDKIINEIEKKQA